MALEWPVMLLVLFSALLHASWNAITKSGRDPLLTIWVVTGTGGLIAGAGTLWVDFPVPAAWPYLAGSLVLHLGYQLFLVSAYRVGDLSQVYPVARGLSPCVVAGLAAAFAGEHPGPVQLAGLALVSLGIASLSSFAPSAAVTRASGGSADPRWAFAAALVTGLWIGGYTFVDGRGVRLCERPADFIAWSLCLDALPITVVTLATRRRAVPGFLRREGLRAAAGGVMATVAYGIVLWALARGGMAQVSALRETSVVAAALIGTRLLREPFGVRRVVAAVVVALGIVLLQS